jgi:PHP family Zn ribbon phosphoesterase
MTEEYDLISLRNSDAHSLEQIGYLYNELFLDELYTRAMPAA